MQYTSDSYPILEYYPGLPIDSLNHAVQRINENKSHWDPPFYMDVEKYANITEFKEKTHHITSNSNIENLIILGTGGSYQTMKALALFSTKKIHFLTSSRPLELISVLNSTQPENSVVIPISRAGKTLDINAILPLFREYPMVGLASQGPMFEMVKSYNATIIDVPDLAGRFAASVCSVALVPALLAGIDLTGFQRGLKDGYKRYSDLQDLQQNDAARYAVFLDMLYYRGYRNIFSMPYSKWLEGLTGLFVQEISESSGKSNKGLMGTYQEAPLCQHSVLEYLLGGSKGYTTPLLWTTATEPEDIELQSADPIVMKQTGLSIINYQADATFQAFLEQQIPSAMLTLSTITPYSFGYMIAFIQSCVYYYCVLSDVNWSSNPMVNLGKQICTEALRNQINTSVRKSHRTEVASRNFRNFYH